MSLIKNIIIRFCIIFSKIKQYWRNDFVFWHNRHPFCLFTISGPLPLNLSLQSDGFAVRISHLGCQHFAQANHFFRFENRLCFVGSQRIFLSKIYFFTVALLAIISLSLQICLTSKTLIQKDTQKVEEENIEFEKSNKKVVIPQKNIENFTPKKANLSQLNNQKRAKRERKIFAQELDPLRCSQIKDARNSTYQGMQENQKESWYVCR